MCLLLLSSLSLTKTRVILQHRAGWLRVFPQNVDNGAGPRGCKSTFSNGIVVSDSVWLRSMKWGLGAIPLLFSSLHSFYSILLKALKAKVKTHCIFHKDVGSHREIRKECHIHIHSSAPLSWDLPKDREDPERYFKNWLHGTPVMRPACWLLGIGSKVLTLAHSRHLVNICWMGKF